MVIARSLAVTHTFAHEGVTYTLRTLPNRVLLALPNLDDEQRLELVIRAGLCDWKGLIAPEGGEVECQQGAATVCGVALKSALSMDSFDVMPFEHIPDVAHEILRVNKLSDDDVGN